MYQPSDKILKKYADVLVKYALNNLKGIRKGDVVLCQVEEPAKPLLKHLQRAVLEAGGHPLLQLIPSGMSRQFYELANEKQLTFFPAKFLKARMDTIDHSVTVVAEDDLHELDGVNPKRIMRQSLTMKPYVNWHNEKENKGKFTWTLALYGTEAMAKEAGMSLEQYWQQIIRACYLDHADPIKRWGQTMDELHRVRDKLDSLKIQQLHIKAPGTDLIVGLGKDRQWMAAKGRNIPTYELFISPDCRKTEGHITFNQSLYHYGSLITGVQLWFKNGKVVKAKAKKGEKLLKEMIRTKGANMVGEYSLTDGRVSRITKFMADTLYDENRGGKYGNTHLALGRAYQDSYPGNVAKVSKAQWKAMGYNDSVVHTDIVSTTNRTVTATLANDKELVIYKEGKFTI